jgi:hypothetical protein
MRKKKILVELLEEFARKTGRDGFKDLASILHNEVEESEVTFEGVVDEILDELNISIHNEPIKHQASARDLFNAFTAIDGVMNGHGPIMSLSPREMFEMGQFYQWALPIVDDPNTDLEELVEVPNVLYWVIGETQGW